MKKTDTVTVIVPAYNVEDYIQRCLDSIYEQTTSAFEIIVINDGSTDKTLDILKDNAKKHKELIVIDQTNHGQGYARNYALDKARGEFILFVDADDFIEPLTIETTLQRIIEDNSDFVHFDWKYLSLHPTKQRTYYYLNKEPYAHKRLLENGECDELLQMTHFFSVNNLYRKSFLNKHKIRYGESRVYEDNIFVTLTVNRAQKISLLHSPLYVIQRNMASSTREKAKDDTHYKSFITAINDSFAVFKPRTKFSNYYLIKYFQTKFVFYYIKRVPRKYKTAYLKSYVDAIGDREVVIPENGQPDRILRLSQKYDIFHKRKYTLFASIIYLKTQVLVRRDKAKNKAKSIKSKVMRTAKPNYYTQQLKNPLQENSIVFLGFDYRYTGNSRYLFDEIIKDKRFKNISIKFITDDTLVDGKYRVSPHTDEYYRLIAQSKYIIAESWIPRAIVKRPGMVWLQLWHGTPLKKMLFDSNEPEIIKSQPRHKIDKYNNTQDWDYLLADSKAAVDKFASAFLFKKENILLTGYPRVKYLIDNKDNEKLKAQIKETLGFSDRLKEKKIVLYAPTWRDYNYGKSPEKQDFSYFIDINTLADKLGNDYIVACHDHHYLSQMPSTMRENCIDVSSYETQDLLLITDHLVTDYSSIMFDAFAVNLPTTLYINDFDRYSDSRGVYLDMWHDVSQYRSYESIDLVINEIKHPRQISEIDDRYSYTKSVDLIDTVYALVT